MNQRRTLELDGLILTVRDFNDSHRIVEVLTPDEGRLSLLARGGRASKRRFAGALDLFVSLRLQVRTGGNLWTLTAADVLNARIEIRRDLDALARASALVELTRALAPEQQASPDLYAVATEALDRVAAGDLAGAASAFPALLAVAGLLPDTRACARCGAAREGTIVDDGFVCVRCRPVSGALTNAVRRVWAGERCETVELANAVQSAVLDFVEQSLGVRFKSRSMQL